MAEELKGLIEKIQQEAIQAGEDKAKTIEGQARIMAEGIIAGANKEARGIIHEVKAQAVKLEESTKVMLKQASRDVLINLRKEIGAVFDKLLYGHLHNTMSSQSLSKIIIELIKNHREDDKKDIIISVSSDDLEKLRQALMSELVDETKKGITLKASEAVRGGFTISYDNGKSCYDFTDKSLVEYIGSYLKPELVRILEGTAEK